MKLHNFVIFLSPDFKICQQETRFHVKLFFDLRFSEIWQKPCAMRSLASHLSVASPSTPPSLALVSSNWLENCEKIRYKWIFKVITVVATALNVVKFVGHLELFTECEVRSAQIIMELHSKHQIYVVSDNFSSGQRRLRGSTDKVHRLWCLLWGSLRSPPYPCQSTKESGKSTSILLFCLIIYQGLKN